MADDNEGIEDLEIHEAADQVLVSAVRTGAEGELVFTYPATNPVDALYVTRQHQLLGPLPIMPDFPNLPPAVYLFIYFQEASQQNYGQDIIPFMLNRQMLVGPSPPVRFLTTALNNMDAFYFCVLRHISDEFSPMMPCTFSQFMEREVLPHWDSIPPLFQQLIAPYRQPAPPTTGTGDNL